MIRNRASAPRLPRKMSALPCLVLGVALACAPGASASTISSSALSQPTLSGQTGSFQQWSLRDSNGSVVATLSQDPVVYDGTGPLPANCADTDAAPGDGTASELTCGPAAGTSDATAVTAITTRSASVGSDVDGSALTATRLVAWGSSGVDTLTGGGVDDQIIGFPGNDVLTGNGGNDVIIGHFGNDVIDAGAGDDWVDGQSGNDTVAGGDGDDTLNAGTGNDRVSGDAGEDVVKGLVGNDTLDGGAGNDFIYGDASCTRGDDVITGGDGDDYIDSDFLSTTCTGPGGKDAVDGGAGDDTAYEIPDGQPDRVAGGTGVDMVYYVDDTAGGPPGATESIRITLDGIADDGETTSDNGNNFDVENSAIALPSDSTDVPAAVAGNDAANVLNTGGGNDAIAPGLGADVVRAYGGDDTVTAQDGYPDHIDCSDGNDTADVDQFDTVVHCETVNLVQMRSAYDLIEPVPEPQPIASPAPAPAPPAASADHSGPLTQLGVPQTLTLKQFLKGVSVDVACNEECAVQVRLLASQRAGRARSSKSTGFNLVLGRTTVGFRATKRTLRVHPCASIRSSAQRRTCVARVRNAASHKGGFTAKVHVITVDRFGNRTQTVRLVRVSATKRAGGRPGS
jgi:Ca2+-binding RTX toxin-like protein